VGGVSHPRFQRRVIRAALGCGALLGGFALLGCRQSTDSGAFPASAPAQLVCGGAEQPDCPTQRWMKSTLQSYLRSRDFKRLESSFVSLAERAPQGFVGWNDIASAGATAARAGDETGVRSSCQACHDQHRSRFRQTDRQHELF
jgi:hypothetical protein